MEINKAISRYLAMKNIVNLTSEFILLKKKGFDKYTNIKI